ncbi:MAG: serine hydrolase [Alphaproteobacteria bacterium]|nr:serine hydrolase [Alphaproteobacteria bacterium]
MFIRIIKWFAGGVGLIVALIVAFLAWQWPYAVYMYRGMTVPRGTEPADAANYLPVVERVAGAARALPGADAARDDARFEDAIAYAETMKSWSFLIWHDDKLLVERYGNGGTADTRGESASMHKSVMAMVVGHALADGIIKSLEDPIGNYIDEWRGDDRGEITVRQLLTMTSGLTTTSAAGGPFSETVRFQTGLFPESLLLSRQIQRPAGANFEYLNVNSNLIGLILQRHLGARYSAYLSEKVWKPLGAADAFVVPARPGGFIRTSGTLLAMPRDWLRLGIMLKNGGEIDGQRVLPPGWLEQMITPSALNPRYGLQIWLSKPHVEQRFYNDFKTGVPVIEKEAFLAEDTFYFDGFGGQRVYVTPSENLVIVRTGPARFDWDDSAIPNMVVRALRGAS